MPKKESSPGRKKRISLECQVSPRPTSLAPISEASNRWRKSKVRRTRKISRTLALKYYKLEPSDLEGVSCVESPSPNGNLNLTISLYNERAVERVAWRKYGGPEGFEKHLNMLRDEYLQTHPLGDWEFQHPDAYLTGPHPGRDVDSEDNSPMLIPDHADSPWSTSVYISRPSTRSRSRTKTPKGEIVPLFSYEPLQICPGERSKETTPLHTRNDPGIAPSLPAFAKMYQRIPTPMQTLQREFASMNCTWLWDAATRVLAFPSNISDWCLLTVVEREAALRALLEIARTYPPRPVTPPPTSPVYEVLRALLQRAPSLTDGTRCKLVLHEFFGGRRIWLWDADCMSELFAALISIINEHGCGEQGWMSVRWEVYDTFSIRLQGLSYRNHRWYDGASDWLRGRMELPGKHSVTTRQDNTSEFGKWYNSILPG
ncbi:hypothetical protein C8R44DRAFT_804146 [Mycena epipterygia]|nr:hypothetical protein C8R44DRAFT_804146 [Mycena epipterygia]